ncbi:MAG TPA: TonB-dependent receptor [Anaeromyxobacter sp.]|nr:TonB-dependent receptor [Anaeromyxobacter sp.]
MAMMLRRLVRLVLLGLLFVGTAIAQGTSSITGVVTDASNGKPVVGAVVVVTGPAEAGEQTAVTEAGGKFTVPNLPPGDYKLAVQMDGYKPFERADLKLKEATTLRANAAVVPESVQMEEVVVTGTRIKRKDLNTPAPVTVVSEQQIQASGKMNLGDFLQSLPEQGGGLNTTVNNGGDGSTQISLRYLGSQRTLVLVDGKRFITAVPGGGNLGDPGVDLNSIPPGAVERIEILKDGASAVYGSDAIAGVVNIITRKRMNGVEFRLNGSQSSEGDAGVVDFNVLAGASSDKGGFMIGGGYYHQGSVFAADRSWAANALTYDYAAQEASPGGSSRIPSGRAQVDPSTCSTPLCQALAAAYGPGKKQFMPATTTADPVNDPVVTVGNQSWRQYTNADAYNFQAVNYLITPSERYSLYANGDYQINDYVRAYFHGTYVNRQSSNLLAPVPLDTGSFSIVYSANNFYNPFGVDLLDARRRFVEASGRSQAFNIGTLHTFFGFDGTLPKELGPLANWSYDLYLGYARNDSKETTNGSVNTQLTGNAIGPSSADGTQCLTGVGGAVIPNCTPANWFNSGNSPMTPAMVTSLGAFTGINSGGNSMFSLGASLSGELFKLWADNPTALAVGFEHRYETGFFTYNPIAVQGIDSDYNGENTHGSYSVGEVYGELSIPILSNKPLVDSLEAVAAIRYSDYSSFGGDTTYKFGARYSPIRDITFRGTASTGFRAPGITSLYGGTIPNAEAATDPCAGPPLGPTIDPNSDLGRQCAAQLTRGGGGAVAVNNGNTDNQILSKAGGNPKLQPEKATIYTAGVVLEPRFVPGLSLTADFYNIGITQDIGYIGTPTILAGCYPGPGGVQNQAYCDLIKRGANGQISGNDGVIDTLQNVGTTTTNGIDVAGRYNLHSGIGEWGFLADVNFLLLYDQRLPDGTLVHGKGNFDLGASSIVNGALPDYKFNLGVTYANKGFAANVYGHYIAGYIECADPDGISSGSGLCYKNNLQPDGTPYPVHHVPFYQTYDANIGYTFAYGWGTTALTLGIRNVFNQNPAPVYNTLAQTNSDPYTYDYVGRDYYFQLLQKF